MKRYINSKGQFATSSMMIGGRMVSNPTEEMLIEAGYHEYVEPAKTLKEAKAEKINEITTYDNSDAVNSITIKHGDMTLPYWLDRDARAQLKSSVQTMEGLGNETYRLDFRAQGFTMEVNCEKFISALDEMESYATQCFRVTTDHILAVNKLTSISDVLAYDYKSGYPDNPTIEL